MSEIKFNGISITTVPYITDGRKDTAYIALISGLMVCTNSRDQARKAAEQVGSGTDVRNSPGFTRVLLASGKNVDKVFVVFPNLPDLLRPLAFIRPKEAFTDKIARLAGTAGGDIYISEDGLVLSGYTEMSRFN